MTSNPRTNCSSGNSENRHAKPPGPLHGVRVLDLTQVVFGPLATRRLAELGAEVWKVEPPYGEVGRQMGAVAAPGVSSIHLTCNAGKRGVCLDLRASAVRAVLLRMAAKADVFIHSMTPATIAALGLTYPEVTAARPDIVYANLWGFGRGGRYAGAPAYDDIIQGLSGLVGLEKDTTGVEAFSPSILCDKVCALYAVSEIAAALFGRARTGTGVELEFPMFEIMTAVNAVEHLDQLVFDTAGRSGYRRALSPHRRPYLTLDGAVTILPHKDRHWRAVAGLLGRPELADDPRLATVAARAANPALVTDLLSDFAAARTSSECLNGLRSGQIPCGPVRSLDELVDDPHLADVGFWQRLEHPVAGAIRLPGVPGRAAGSGRLAPELGEHTATVLAECGFPAAEIDELCRTGVARQATVVTTAGTSREVS
ncbi:CaiB/BaiF CoA transferase family protein [Amycolatopsis pigmentata]|uniref:CaiB/BaiF CoA transferase family protein n=1 Tax=Amycolatopsis pigmentata TaxID=450801 RepID=A0ABW5FMP5_9PSEU